MTKDWTDYANNEEDGDTIIKLIEVCHRQTVLIKDLYAKIATAREALLEVMTLQDDEPHAHTYDVAAEALKVLK